MTRGIVTQVRRECLLERGHTLTRRPTVRERQTRAAGRIVGEERLLTDLGERVRDVAVAADGAVWVVTDETNGKLVRLAVR